MTAYTFQVSPAVEQVFTQHGITASQYIEQLFLFAEKNQQLPKLEVPFNFDLERMEERVNDRFHEVPNDVTNVIEFRTWLDGIANGR